MKYDDWEKQYNPVLSNQDINDASPRLFETYGEDLELICNTDPEKVWTVVDCDGHLYLLNGLHFVNRINYLVTEISHDINDLIEIDYED